MALPKLETPTYMMERPSTGNEIKYRPFLVKEEKILLLAMEENTAAATHQAVLDLVNACTFGEIGSKTDPMFDIEYAFLKIRQKSISETVTVNLLCPDDNETYVETEINLEDIEVTLDVDHDSSCSLGKDMSGNDVSIELSYPTAASSMLAQKTESPTEQIFSVVKSCIKSITFGEDVYNIVDISKKELDEFVDSLTQDQFATLQAFFDTMPKLRHKVEITNPNTKVKSTVTLEGLSDFLD
mgnify:CR=1 FL=1